MECPDFDHIQQLLNVTLTKENSNFKEDYLIRIKQLLLDRNLIDLNLINFALLHSCENNQLEGG